MAGPPINFGAIDFGTGEDVIPPIDPIPHLSTVSSSSVTDSENPLPQSTAAAAPCSCSASMYLSLASLQQFPTDIVSALATVRGAAATASNCIWCPQCGPSDWILLLLRLNPFKISCFRHNLTNHSQWISAAAQNDRCRDRRSCGDWPKKDF